MTTLAPAKSESVTALKMVIFAEGIARDDTKSTSSAKCQSIVFWEKCEVAAPADIQVKKGRWTLLRCFAPNLPANAHQAAMHW
jgi:hypothetical protein